MSVQIERYSGFSDAGLRAHWDEALRNTRCNHLFLTRVWHELWWRSFARGELAVYTVRDTDGQSLIAPLFFDGNMAFFTGAGASDYQDFIGDGGTEHVAALLRQVRADIEDFVGLRFYQVPADSHTPHRVTEVCTDLGMVCVQEEHWIAPQMSMCRADAALGKKSLRRHQRWFETHGNLEVIRHGVSDIADRLSLFFEQHCSRWADTGFPSLFRDPAQRGFYKHLAASAEMAEWLRFTEVRFDGQPIAFHFGFNFAETFLWYKPSFEPEWASRSPGEVLLRALLLQAQEEAAETFDFGLGDESFKARFASHQRTLVTLGVYPADLAAKHDRRAT